MTVWQTKEGRRAMFLAGVLRWPILGALIAGGALVLARYAGPPVARELGRRGGEGFAEGVAQAQAQLAVSGRWSRYA